MFISKNGTDAGNGNMFIPGIGTVKSCGIIWGGFSALLSHKLSAQKNNVGKRDLAVSVHIGN